MSKRTIIGGILMTVICAIPVLSSAAPTPPPAPAADVGPLACANQGNSCKKNEDCCNYSCQWDNGAQKYLCDK